MTNNFVLIIVIASILLISLDLAFFLFHRRKQAGHQPFQALARVIKKLANFSPATGENNVTITDNAQGNDVSQLSPENTVAPLENQTFMIPTDPDSTNHPPQSPEAAPSEPKTVHIQFPAFSADIPEGTIVNITLEVINGQGKTSVQKTSLTRENAQPGPNNARQFLSAIRLAAAQKFGLQNLDQLLLLATLAVYALTVSIGIDRFPIYFFTDEAIHMNLASDFLRDGYRNYFGELLPTFFTTGGWVNGTSIYVQVLPFLIFGKSVAATRLVSAFISLLGALALGMLLKDVFKFKFYWVGIFLVLTTPAWFLHARTVFEYVEVGSFYSIFLYFYSRYRAGYLSSLYWAIIAGALAFYTHGLGQILMSVTGLALFIVDFRYHIHPDRRKTVLTGLLLGTILLLPFARYYLAHPGEAAAQIKRRDSYWANANLSLTQKLGQFFGQYAYGLSPAYWYFPNQIDLIRHIMNKYGNGLLLTLPVMLVGLIQTLRNIRQPAYRMVLIALLACPIPASVVAIGMPRMLWMTIPLALLTAIGLMFIIEWVETRWRLQSNWLGIGLFILFAGLSTLMLKDALVNGPTWFTNYSLYGMQYGAKQVFQDVVRTGLEQDPNRRYIVSPSWANGTEQFIAFFVPKNLQSRLRMGQPVDFIDLLKQNPTDLYFVATADEYNKLLNNPEFTDIKIAQMLPFPDGNPGFYVISLNVAGNIDQLIAAQKELEVTPVEEPLALNGQKVRIVHSPIGSGSLQDVFDTNPDTKARVLRANPFMFDLYPSTPIDTQSVTIQTGSLADFTITISLYAPGATDPVTYTQTFQNLPPDPMVTMNFDKGPAQAARIYIAIKDNRSGESSQIHVRTIQFK